MDGKITTSNGKEYKTEIIMKWLKLMLISGLMIGGVNIFRGILLNEMTELPPIMYLMLKVISIVALIIGAMMLIMAITCLTLYVIDPVKFENGITVEVKDNKFWNSAVGKELQRDRLQEAIDKFNEPFEENVETINKETKDNTVKRIKYVCPACGQILWQNTEFNGFVPKCKNCESVMVEENN